jgi:NAD(P)-dependent dehydrogenase (short-subunit alcohol dehydrogenase family)
MGIYDGQVVVVAGGGAGIGAAAAELLAARGAIVIVCDVAKTNADTVANSINISGGNSVARELNVANQGSVVAFIDSIVREFGRLDAIVNSAGIVGPTNTPLEKITPADIEKVLAVNLLGAVWLTQAALPHMKAAKYGRIVHVASIAGKEGNPGMTPYVLSKAAMIGFVKAIAKEVATDGITINSIAPAVIKTPMNANTSEETLKYMISRIPMGRLGEAEEVAEMISFAASKACSFTTGFCFDTSGGRATY